MLTDIQIKKYRKNEKYSRGEAKIHIIKGYKNI